MTSPMVVSLHGGRGDRAKANREALAASLVDLAAHLSGSDEAVVAGVFVLLTDDGVSEELVQVSSVGRTSSVLGALDLARLHVATTEDD